MEKLMSVSQAVESIKGITDVESDELKNEIICAFGDYQYKGISEIIVSNPDISRKSYFNAYANHADAPIVAFETAENEDGTVSVADAWIV